MEQNIRLFTLLLVLLSTLIGFADPSDGKKLLKELFKKSDYQKSLRPVEKENQNVTVQLSSSLLEITDLDTERSLISLRVQLYMLWNDPQLKWDSEDYNGRTKLFLSPNQIWTPDIDIRNGVKTDFKDIQVMVYENGGILWMPIVKVQVTCNHEFRSDSWQCPLNIGSWVYTGKEMDIKPTQDIAHLDIEDVTPSTKFIVMSADGKKEMRSFACCTDKFPVIEIMIKLRNRIGHPALMGKRNFDWNF